MEKLSHDPKISTEKTVVGAWLSNVELEYYVVEEDIEYAYSMKVMRVVEAMMPRNGRVGKKET